MLPSHWIDVNFKGALFIKISETKNKNLLWCFVFVVLVYEIVDKQKFLQGIEQLPAACATQPCEELTDHRPSKRINRLELILRCLWCLNKNVRKYISPAFQFLF